MENNKYQVISEFKGPVFENSVIKIYINDFDKAGEYQRNFDLEPLFITGVYEFEGRSVGTLCMLLRAFPRDDSVVFSARAVSRIQLTHVFKSEKLFGVDFAAAEKYPNIDCPADDQAEALIKSINNYIVKFAGTKETNSLYLDVQQMTVNTIWSWVNVNYPLLKHGQPQAIFALDDDFRRLNEIKKAFSGQASYIKVDRDFQKKVNDEINNDQKEYYLREQLKIINQELYGGDSDLEEYRMKIDSIHADTVIKDKLYSELSKVAGMQSGTPESYVSRNYIDLVCALPWGKYSAENNSLANAREILENDHYGINEVKERVLEFLAIRKLVSSKKGNILCFYGPPGTGKTSIVKSIARALGRKYVRLSLGGVHDEAEIRGHRRTYIGALAGKIITGIRDAGTMNPVFLMDEVDKLSSDQKGDPASALLEVLDPEQNKAFVDNFVDLPFDLSQVLFVTTANNISTIAKPLLDRMELIEMSSYTSEEKEEIAVRHLIPKQLQEHGVPENTITFSRNAVTLIINQYTREAGVRYLEQQIAKICRKLAVKYGDIGFCPLTVDSDDIYGYLGAPKYINSDMRPAEVGVITGLAYTEYGGVTLEMECVLTSGKGNLVLTGSLGDVMKESASEAYTYIKANAERFGIDQSLFAKDVNVNATEGAVPKDGPSAGIALTIVILSAFLQKKIRSDVALTGEMTLSGRVLPIGGVKEKSLGAIRQNIHIVILPALNKRDVDELPATIKEKVKYIFVERVEQAIEVMLNENNKG